MRHRLLQRTAAGAAVLALALAAAMPSLAQDAGRIWTGSTYQGGGSVAHGVPETDDSDVALICPGPGRAIEMSFPVTLAQDFLANPTIEIIIDGQSFTPVASALHSELNGGHEPMVSLFAGNPLLDAIIAGNRMQVTVRAANGPYGFEIPLAGSAAAIRANLAACL